ncbi:Hpt domain-containing protein [Asticcacaulis sp. AC402]|uniref:Hpt domain-containing protein n=1 Tax=Asticcacaulis sp. AC402 TaxID=1282361 RepID=UPI0003C3ED3C|nr:Hpt domain-containing protein [Asticcacaulis sp. AC402]ESQ76976.1 Hpt domain-containing protein [Asticcacaulis sp. AC402]
MALRDVTGAVDFAHLEDYTLNDAEVMEEVLRLFQQQSDLWAPLLNADHEGWRDAAHTLKGAAAGIGANDLAALAGEAERGDLAGAAGRLEKVKTALAAALMDVSAYLHHLQLRSLRG